MNLRRFLANRLVFVASALTFAVILSCGDGGDPIVGPNGGGPRDNWVPNYACAGAEQKLDDVPNRDAADLGLENAVVITFGNGSVTVDNPHSLITYISDGSHVTVRNTNLTEELNIVLKGSAPNGSFKIYGDRPILGLGLYLNGIDITNPSGPAINIQRGGNIRDVTVHLVGGCDDRANRIADRANYDMPPGEEDARGTFFSEANVTFTGTGSLEIRSRYRHAIAVDNKLVINSGNIIIHESPGNGIRAHDFQISGGTLQFKTVGDAIQSKRNNRFLVSGGKMTLWTTGIKAHGFACDSNNVVITGNPTINITTLGNGAKGIRSRGSVDIGGGTIDIKTYGNLDITPIDQRDPENTDTTSRAIGIKAENDVLIKSGATLKVVSSGDRARGISTGNDVIISGGDVDINANNDGINVNGYFRMSGGNVRVRAARSGQDIDCGGRYERTGGTLDAGIDERKN